VNSYKVVFRFACDKEKKNIQSCI